ncbi:MAG: excisionase family DNA-binding protein [Actinomycetia bacterium]|nr:excisionase family DNA-binding protein [Actinomycetes bacterium]
MPMPIRPQTLNDEETLAASDRAAGLLADYLRRHPTPTTRVQLVDDDSPAPTTIEVPAQALKLFIEILDHLKDGVGVTVVPSDADLTTQQAADLVGVSRPYLIDKILEPTGPVPFRTVGRHRRIKFADLQTYLRADTQKRKRASDRVTRIGLDAGLDD